VGIWQASVERGLLSAQEAAALSDMETLELIYRPISQPLRK
jgi:chemotaxis protein histidine kinase CheA